MPKEAVFTMKLEAELRDAFMAEAAELDRPASQIMRDLMKEFIRKREEEKQGYIDFLARKVAIARRQMKAGKSFSSEEVEAEFAARRAELLRRADEDDA